MMLMPLPSARILGKLDANGLHPVHLFHGRSDIQGPAFPLSDPTGGLFLTMGDLRYLFARVISMEGPI